MAKEFLKNGVSKKIVVKSTGLAEDEIEKLL